jgi:hypothetical protein
MLVLGECDLNAEQASAVNASAIPYSSLIMVARPLLSLTTP